MTTLKFSLEAGVRLVGKIEGKAFNDKDLRCCVAAQSPPCGVNAGPMSCISHQYNFHESSPTIRSIPVFPHPLPNVRMTYLDLEPFRATICQLCIRHFRHIKRHGTLVIHFHITSVRDCRASGDG
jgi:hypothetical protein